MKKKNLVKIAVGATALVMPCGLVAVAGVCAGKYVVKNGIRSSVKSSYDFALRGYDAVRTIALDICSYPFKTRRFKKPSKLEQA